LYSRSAKLRLPFKALTEEYKVGKVRLQMMLQDSKDTTIRNAEPCLRTGRKWKACEATKNAQEAAKLNDIVGLTQTNRHGLGFAKETKRWWSNSSSKDRRDLTLREIRQECEDARLQEAVQQSQQGQWTSWEDALQRSLTWEDIWHMAPLRISFLIRAMYDQLPTGANLARWNVAQDVKCALCGESETLQHVLSACKVALGNGRYTWRHNQVLKVVAEVLQFAISKATTKPRERLEPIKWVKAGALPVKADKQVTTNRSILNGANDWQLASDLPNYRAYPQVIRDTNLRPDAVVLSETAKTIVLIELTVPYETNMSESHEYKLAKYEQLVHSLSTAGYSTHLFAVEVGARGLVGSSAFSLVQRLGITGKLGRQYMKRLAEAAEKASGWIWTKRKEPGWKS